MFRVALVKSSEVAKNSFDLSPGNYIKGHGSEEPDEALKHGRGKNDYDAEEDYHG